MRGTTVAAVVLALLLVASGAFAVGGGPAARPDPVPFDRTVQTGATTAEWVRAEAEGTVVPRAEIFYAEYRYVVGVYGVEALVDELGGEGTSAQFGAPLAVYVNDFSGTAPTLAADGGIVVDREPGWVPAERATFVVDSAAATPGGGGVLAFSDRAGARAFAGEHGGTLADWTTLRERSFGTDAAVREQFYADVDARHRWADAAAADARALLDRPVSVVVGEDAPTVAAAVEVAPPNTTVRIPAGTYRVPELTVDRPITLAGVGTATRLVGDGNGSVVRATAPGVAVADLAIDGVGTDRTDPGAGANESAWDYRVRVGYGGAPAGVQLDGANGSLVHDVAIDTSSHGVLVREADGVVVDGADVDGPGTWSEGFMGVMVIDARVAVQDSSFDGGRDGVYLHRGHGSVVRDNRMVDLRFGVHEMYTDDTLVAANTVRGASVGVIVMTPPVGNAVVGNDVRDSAGGLSVVGSASLVAENVLVDNGYGIDVATDRSLVERNVLANNGVGARASTLVPTNRVVHNDFVDNDRHVVAPLGPLRTWSADGAGNYWSGAAASDADGDGRLDRAVVPTAPVDARAHQVPGAPTLARSPALGLLDAVGDVSPGLRTTGVRDAAPLAEPVRPAVVANVTDSAASTAASPAPTPDGDAGGGRS